MHPYAVPSTLAEPDTEPDTARFSAEADTLPDTALADASAELEDTQPSRMLPSFEDEAFFDAPTLPGMRLSGIETAELPATSVRDGQWDRVLAAVTHAVRRVFASHSP